MAVSKKEKKPRPHFQKIVTLFFDFCREKFGENPSFDGSAPRDLGMILDAMEKKAGEKNLIWTEDMATRAMSLFLEYCWKDSWLNQNFLLCHMNRQKDKIFFKIKSEASGNSKTSTNLTGANHKTAGQHVFADRLKKRIEGLTGGRVEDY